MISKLQADKVAAECVSEIASATGLALVTPEEAQGVRAGGLYPWSMADTHRIHPTDLESWRALKPVMKVFLQDEREGAYVVLKYGQQRVLMVESRIAP
ncbi:MAG: hypothetical protein ACI9KE_000390 [Polyangiales bacterium]|jgi:hypothetical protein